MGITHAAVVAIPDDGSSPVGSDEWNADHVAAIDDLSDVDTAGVADGDTLIFDSGDSTWKPGAAGGSSGGPDGQPWLLAPPASPSAYDDEFNDATGMSGVVNGLDAAWTPLNMTAGTDFLFSDDAPGNLVIKSTPTSNAIQGLFRTAPSGDFALSGRILLNWSNGRNMWGICIVDSSGDGVWVGQDTGDSATRVRTLSAYAQTGNPTNVRVAGFAPTANGALTVNIRKASGVYYFWGSYSDRILRPASTLFEATATPSAFTVDRIGILKPSFGTDECEFYVDFLRVYT